MGNVLCFSQNNIVKIFITVNSSNKKLICELIFFNLFKSCIKYLKYNIHIIKLQVHFTNMFIRHIVFSIHRPKRTYTVKNKFSTDFYVLDLLKLLTCIQISLIIHYGQATWKIIRLYFHRYFTSKRYERVTLGVCTVVRFTQY